MTRGCVGTCRELPDATLRLPEIGSSQRHTDTKDQGWSTVQRCLAAPDLLSPDRRSCCEKHERIPSRRGTLRFIVCIKATTFRYHPKGFPAMTSKDTLYFLQLSEKEAQ
ncbi:hypothetical protein HBH70_175380 [Parastagonospora nodorum]|nr:hypothetical protein HBH75_190410 [Parastagonospora nodorum]KAH5131533.1 hypothetical protein HBH70_175380 [Parastagonospora nodorum]KAH5207020.1 hypothetical protein HBH77_094440 [Parastagonospora nodorum]KAH5759053.1 hypothetical protein HBI97_202330 [Parastagonospora nodorum]KAH5792040.1 hypothetical protein HBI96_199600 [Parastagonospora nodorum]